MEAGLNSIPPATRPAGLDDVNAALQHTDWYIGVADHANNYAVYDCDGDVVMVLREPPTAQQALTLWHAYTIGMRHGMRHGREQVAYEIRRIILGVHADRTDGD